MITFPLFFASVIFSSSSMVAQLLLVHSGVISYFTDYSTPILSLVFVWPKLPSYGLLASDSINCFLSCLEFSRSVILQIWTEQSQRSHIHHCHGSVTLVLKILNGLQKISWVSCQIIILIICPYHLILHIIFLLVSWCDAFTWKWFPSNCSFTYGIQVDWLFFQIN